VLNIQPIKLLSSSHDDTDKTGQGCFMNVIAYLNGEPQITDRSPCVCVTVRPIAIRLNDMANDEQRQRLIPFIERAMGSTTEDRTEMIRRAYLAADFAEECSRITAKYAAASAASAKYVAKYAAAKYAAKSAEYAAEYAAESAAESAAKSAEYAAESAKYAEYAEYAEVFEAGLRFLDAALPRVEVLTFTPEVEARAQKLVELCHG